MNLKYYSSAYAYTTSGTTKANFTNHQGYCASVRIPVGFTGIITIYVEDPLYTSRLAPAITLSTEDGYTCEGRILISDIRWY